jgi:hypothetical protein
MVVPMAEASSRFSFFKSSAWVERAASASTAKMIKLSFIFVSFVYTEHPLALLGPKYNLVLFGEAAVHTVSASSRCAPCQTEWEKSVNFPLRSPVPRFHFERFNSF